jgi:hypothetical protein
VSSATSSASPLAVVAAASGWLRRPRRPWAAPATMSMSSPMKSLYYLPLNEIAFACEMLPSESSMRLFFAEVKSFTFRPTQTIANEH